MLLKLLGEHGWDLVSRDSDTDWWVEERWRIRAVRENWGEELIVSFLVEPQHEGRNKSAAVWAVAATADVARDRSDAERGIALVSVAKGKLKERLPVLVRRLDEHRHGR